ncbi:unnamed protein product [Spirodela intermedia]|uniref:CobW/HypB/UreG nucleotide-binding domain-containing protein n=1 Tax=Spirodela intermedia TaxID=51605 RepID=A0A7I8LJX9_SPIIN|nr:unnamed protein product [Spirodela intermedia]
MEGNEMSMAFENRLFNRRVGLGGVARMGCTLVTGFLGSGKTTLLRHLLRHRGDLRLAVLVNEFADFDVDSILLDSDRLNKAFNLPSVSFTLGEATFVQFSEVLRGIVDSKQNFDCLLIETSGLARPDSFLTTLEEVGIHLDMTVAVVDAESLDTVIKMDIAKKQLQHVDLILLNKPDDGMLEWKEIECDLATLSQISDAEDTLEALTGGAKIIRTQFCRVPLELVIDCSKTESLSRSKEYTADIPFLSHESLSKTTFQEDARGNASVGISSVVNADKHPESRQGTSEDLQTEDETLVAEEEGKRLNCRREDTPVATSEKFYSIAVYATVIPHPVE